MKYQYTSNSYSFEESKKVKLKKIKAVEYVESKEVKLEHVIAQITNDLYEMHSTTNEFNLESIERIVIENLLQKFNRTQTAKLTGLCIRTIRNKINGYKYI